MADDYSSKLRNRCDDAWLIGDAVDYGVFHVSLSVCLSIRRPPWDTTRID